MAKTPSKLASNPDKLGRRGAVKPRQFPKAIAKKTGHKSPKTIADRKFSYRIVDFKRATIDVPATVERLEYDPNRTVFIALLKYADGTRSYILAPQRLAVGDTVIAAEYVEVKPGNVMPLGNMPVGTVVHNVEMKIGKGGQIARSAGTYAQIVGRDHDYVIIRLNSGEQRLVHGRCRATIGAVSNPDHMTAGSGRFGRPWGLTKPAFGALITAASRPEKATVPVRKVERPASEAAPDVSVHSRQTTLSALQRAFLQRSMTAVERLSQNVTEAAMTSALAAPTDIGALARVLADTAVVDAATRELDPFAKALARNAEHRDKLISLSGGLLAAPAAAQLLRVTRQAVDKRRLAKRLLGVKIAGDWAYPAFQFGGGLSVDDLKSVLECLDDSGGWIALDFLLTPDAALGGKTPAETMLLGPEAAARVVRLARAERSDGFS